MFKTPIDNYSVDQIRKDNIAISIIVFSGLIVAISIIWIFIK